MPARGLGGAYVVQQSLEGCLGIAHERLVRDVENPGPEHQGEERGVCQSAVEIGARGHGEPAGRVHAGRQLGVGTLHRLGEQREAPCRNLGQQIREAAEVAGRRAVGDARAARDAAEGKRLEALLGEQLEGHFDQPLGERGVGKRSCGCHVDSVYYDQ